MKIQFILFIVVMVQFLMNFVLFCNQFKGKYVHGPNRITPREFLLGLIEVIAIFTMPLIALLLIGGHHVLQ